MKRFIGLAFILVLAAAPAMAVNNLSVNGAAAMEGSYGLEVSLDGNTPTNVFVQDDTPDNETVYRFQFLINANTWGGPAGEKFALCKTRDVGGPIGNPLTALIRWDGSTMRIAMKYKDLTHPNGLFRTDTLQAFEQVIPSLPTTIMIELVQGSGPGASDGILRLWKNGVMKRESVTLDNETSDVTRFQMGAIGVRAGGNPTGSYYLDSFESYRTLAP